MDPVNAGLGLGDKTVGILDKLLGPWFTRRQADANARAALQEVLTDQAAAYIEAHPNDPVMMEAIMSCHGRFGFENICQLARLAIPQLNENARPDLIGDDWSANYRDKAHTCSDPEMAKLWAQLLAAEANNPGSYARKTVNVLADLEPDDARLFKVVCDFRLNPMRPVTQNAAGERRVDRFERSSHPSKLAVLDENHPMYTDKGVNFRSLARLDWLGLLRYVTPGYVLTHSNEKFVSYEHGGGQLFVASEKRIVPFGHAEFTPAGEQLSELCIPIATPEGFVNYLTEAWRSEDVRVALTQSEALNLRL